MEIAKLHQLFLQSNGISTDTRKIKSGEIFFALSGDNFNGNLYAQEAINKGASYAIIDDNSSKGKQFINTKSTLVTLQKLAKFHREYLSIPILALTGSNGKTTTKELINAVLSKKFKTTATKGNLNNHIGVPLTILSMTKNTQFGIIEMGANHMKEIALLTSIATPNYGLITNIGKAHLEGFGSKENILKGKTELYDFLEKDSNSIVFVNTAGKKLIERSSALHCIYFGLNENSNHFTSTKLLKENPTIELQYNNKLIKSLLMGSYNAENISAAITIGSYFGVPPKDIKAAIEEYTPTNNRSQLIATDTNTITLDAYNANPTSMLLSIQNFENTPKTTLKTVILGDMFELGATSIKEHTSIIEYLIASKNIDRIILVGSLFFESSKGYSITVYKATQDIIELLKQNPIDNNQILIKGSRGMQLETLIEHL